MTTLASLGANVDSVLGAGVLGGAVNVDFDNTVFLQAVLFFALMFLLDPLLFQPVLRIFEEREKRTEGAKDEARAMQEKAGELLRRYEGELERINRVAAEEREKLRVETAKLEAKILDDARAVSTRIVDEGRQQIEEELHSIRFELGRESEKIAEEIVRRVLGKEAA